MRSISLTRDVISSKLVLSVVISSLLLTNSFVTLFSCSADGSNILWRKYERVSYKYATEQNYRKYYAGQLF